MFWEISSDFEQNRNFIIEIPKQFPSYSNTIHQKRNTIKKVTLGSQTYVIKSFGIPNFINKIIYGFFRESKAKRSYLNAHALLKAGISTATPIAYGEERKRGLLGQSYFITQEIEYDFDFHDINFERVTPDERLFVQFAEFSYQMHQAGFLHLDYTPGNVLIKRLESNYQCSVVDINRMYIGPVSWYKGAASFGKFFLKEPWLSVIIKTYAEKVSQPEEAIRAIIEKTHRAFQRKKKWKRFFRGKKG